MSGVFDETIVPAGWFDETAQPLGWFDETELGSTGAAAATAAGFSSWAFLQPFGFGAPAGGTPFTLTQSGQVGIAGALAASGSIGWAISLTQSGQIAVAGAPSLSGDLSYTTQLTLAQSGALGISGTLSPTGTLVYAYGLPLAQSGALGISGTLSPTGDLTITEPWEFQRPARVSTLAGTLTLTGDLSSHRSSRWHRLGADRHLWRSCAERESCLTTALTLAQSGQARLQACWRCSATWPSGRRRHLVLAQSGALAVAGTVTTAGDPHDHRPGAVGQIGIAGAATVWRSADGHRAGPVWSDVDRRTLGRPGT